MPRKPGRVKRCIATAATAFLLLAATAAAAPPPNDDFANTSTLSGASGRTRRTTQRCGWLTVTCKIDDGTAFDCESGAPISLPGGRHTITVTATDGAGNVSTDSTQVRMKGSPKAVTLRARTARSAR